LLRYFLNDFEMVSVAPIITGITFIFTFHMRCISVVRSLYFKILHCGHLHYQDVDLLVGRLTHSLEYSVCVAFSP
jgi:hypothetical protein